MDDDRVSARDVLRGVSIYARFLKEAGLAYAAPTAPPGVTPRPALQTPGPASQTPGPASQTPTDGGALRASRKSSSAPAAASPGAAPAAVSNAPLPAPAPPEESEKRLAEIYGLIAQCRACRLSESRTNTVPGDGSATADLLFIGEGPGADEDRQGVPFVGRAGKKLDEMIAYLGLKREEVYIANIVKCRPPGNRNPAPDEAAACRHFLDTQIELVAPKVICLLGSVALKHITGNMGAAITRMRGDWIAYRDIPVMPTFHPAYLLRSYTVANRKAVAEDMDAIREKLQSLGCAVGAKE